MAHKRQSGGCLLLVFFPLLFEGRRGGVGGGTKSGKNRGLGDSLCIQSVLNYSVILKGQDWNPGR